MNLFKKKKYKVSVTKGNGELVYQSADGTYLPDSQQPDPLDFTVCQLHQSTRYKNVTIGYNGIALMPVKKNENNTEVELRETDKHLPELYTIRANCCGCTACFSICPVSAISMESDEEGFDYPVVNGFRCIRCYRCDGVCPIKKKIREGTAE